MLCCFAYLLSCGVRVALGAVLSMLLLSYHMFLLLNICDGGISVV